VVVASVMVLARVGPLPREREEAGPPGVPGSRGKAR